MRSRKAVIASNLVVTLFIATAALLAMTVPAHAAQEIGKLTYVEGRVDRMEPASVGYLPVVKEEAIFLGDTVRTKSYSRAEIAFADKSVLRLGENSQVRIKEYAMATDGTRQSATLYLDRGKIRTTVAKTKDLSPFTIETPNASGTIKGSDMFVSFQKSSTAVLALEGKMALRNLAFPDKVVEVMPHRTALVGPDAPPLEPRPFAPIEQIRLEQDTAPRATMMEGKKAMDSSKALVTKVTGEVLSRLGNQAPGHKVEVKEAISAGSDIETGPHGQIEIVLESGRVVQLQPNTRLTVKKLSRDPKTGAREDLFESTLGKIRVSVEKLKANSKFEIKTPTAIAGVRGTVMYLNIMPNITAVFFEGGTGYIGNLGIVGQILVKDVGDGHNASADDKGKVSDPVATTPEQRQNLESGWDPQAETFGYSSPEPHASAEGDEAAAKLNHGENDKGEASVHNDKAFSDNLFDQNPPSDQKDSSGQSDTSASSKPVALSLTLSGSGFFNSDGSFVENPARVWTASISSDTDADFWNGTNAALVKLDGNYHHADPPSVWWGNVTGSSSDGGRFHGWIGGAFHSWEGIFASISIAPDKTAGVAIGELAGTSEGSPNGIFTGLGGIVNIPLGIVSIEPSDIELFVQQGALDDGLVEGHFGSDNTGNFIGGRMASGGTLFLNQNPASGASEHFGVFGLQLGGANDYSNPQQNNTWNAFLAGGGTFGRLGEETDDKGFWSLKVIDGSWENGVLQGSLEGSYLTFTQTGVLWGNVHGVYNGISAGNWTAIGLGVFQGAALDFAGKASQEEFTKFDTETCGLPSFGTGEGILGGLGNLYAGDSVPTVLMGRYAGVTSPEPLLWTWNLDSYNIFLDAKTTFDGGSFMGSIGGSWMERQLLGKALMLYISPVVREDGNYDAGILSGAFAGEYGPNSSAGSDGLWTLSGDFSAVPKGVTDIAPENLFLEDTETHDFINVKEMHFVGSGMGTFDTTGTLEERNFDGDTLQIKSQTWGIWRAKMGGVYANAGETFSFASGVIDSPIPLPPASPAVWLTSASGAWSNTSGTTFGEMAGQMKGVWISESQTDLSKFETGSLRGDVMGNHDTQTSTWQAGALGEWVDIALLDRSAVGYTMDTLRNFVSIPITEKYSSLLTTTGSFNGGAGAITGVMDTSFYSSSSPTQGIWTGILNGAFTGMPQAVQNWTATAAGQSAAGAVSASLNGLQWADGKWLANVASTPSSSVNFTGQAGGTYTADASNTQSGTFQGVGTGTWHGNTTQ